MLTGQQMRYGGGRGDNLVNGNTMAMADAEGWGPFFGAGRVEAR